MRLLIYLAFRGFFGIISIIPFRILYVISDIFAFLLQYVMRYRSKVITRNLTSSFPRITTQEIKKIRRQFYRNLSDVMLETAKGYTLNSKTLLKRYKCLNPGLADEFYKEGKNVIFAMSHYGNWEWGTQVAGAYFKHRLVSFYKPFSNKRVDEFINRNRLNHGMRLTSIYETKFIFRPVDERPMGYFLLSDQSPGRRKNAYWVKFLNQETACLHGIEGYARLFDIPVIYVDVQRVKRGYYTVSLELLCLSPKVTDPGEITRAYMQKLEKIIIQKPSDWLWSHRRWKMKKLNPDKSNTNSVNKQTSLQY